MRADGTRHAITYRLRVYTATELAALAREAGFPEIEAYGDLADPGELAPERRLVLVCR